MQSRAGKGVAASAPSPHTQGHAAGTRRAALAVATQPLGHHSCAPASVCSTGGLYWDFPACPHLLPYPALSWHAVAMPAG